MKEKKICAAYVRVSTDDQLDYSPASQKELLHSYAKKNGLLLPEEFVFTDDGISGRKAEKRPAFMELIAKAKSKPRPFDVILVWKFSRFARNQEESIVYKSMLRKQCGIEVVSISEQLPEGEFGSLIERIIEWMDEYYSIRLSGEVRRGMTERVKQGGAVSVAPIGYVYKDKKLTVHEVEAETVRMIYNDFLNGTSMIAIAKKLNEMQIKTKRGGTWENRTVRYVLTNPIYIGKVRWSSEGTNDYHKTDGWNDNTFLVDGTHEPIISEEVFTAAQKEVEKYVHLYKNNSNQIAQRQDATHMLQGIVKCSACGATLTRSGRGQMNCVRYLHGRCTESHSIKETSLQNIVLHAMGMQFDSLDFHFADHHNTTVVPNSNQDGILQQIRREQEILQRCKEAYISGIDTIEEYRENKTSCKARIEVLQQKLSAKTEANHISNKDFAEKYRDALNVLTSPETSGAEKNKVIRSFVDHITFFRDLNSIDIIYKT